jgi:large subunit ribosomal protein L24
MKSKKARKQRKAQYNAALHIRQKFMGAHLSKDLKTQLKIRSLAVRKGDEVKVVRGSFKGKTGKITQVMLKETRVLIDSVKRKKSSGEELHVAIHPSNLIIINPGMDDSKRIKSRK